MKMKKVCQATGLTERAIRLYISKGLIVPGQREGLNDFSPEDVQRLRDIALMRQVDFTIEQIAAMTAHGEEIPAIAAQRRGAAQTGARHEADVAAALTDLNAGEMADLHAFADAIRARQAAPTLNFTQFDELSGAERLQASTAASQAVERQQRRQRLRMLLCRVLCIAAAALTAAGVFLSRTGVEGYLSLSPVTVEAVQGERATFRIGSEQAAEILGRDTITVAYQVDGYSTDLRDPWGRPAIQAGETIDQACLLKISLTNCDLLRLGINPLQDFDPPSVQRHNAWMRLILRAEMEDGTGDNCLLILRGFPGVSPLLWEEE